MAASAWPCALARRRPPRRALGLTASDVAEAIRRNNYQAAPGMVKGQYVLSNVRVNTDLTNVDDFREMVIPQRWQRPGGACATSVPSRTGRRGHRDQRTDGRRSGGAPGVVPDAHRQPAGDRRRHPQLLPEIREALPPDVRVDLATRLRASSRPPSTRWCGPWWKRLLIVVLVIYLCLGSLRSVLIPVATIPLSMLGAALR
ncbi:hypothetical protein ACPA9J_24155 [Pseudomonas aeruginosa]